MHLPKQREVHFLMIKVKGIEGEIITTESYHELLKAVKDEMDRLDAFSPAFRVLGDNSAVVFYDEIPEEETKEEVWRNRYCCECGWFWCRHGCPHKEGHVKVKMPACKTFTIEWIEEE